MLLFIILLQVTLFNIHNKDKFGTIIVKRYRRSEAIEIFNRTANKSLSMPINTEKYV